MNVTSYRRGVSRLLGLTAGIAIIGGAQSVAAQPSASYYSTVDDTSDATLRATLHPVIDDHQRYPYTASSTDTWDILEEADEDPNNTSRVLDVYRNASYQKWGGGNNDYNREHVWPKSYGFPNDGSSNYAYTDAHHLHISNVSYNSSRGNKPFDNCGGSCDEETTNVNNGTGGGTGVYPGNSNWTDADAWETWWGRRGDIARTMFYMDIRYEGGNHGVTGYAEPQLILTDNRSLIQTTGSNASVAYMGLLSVLIQWHNDDPVDALEQRRNNIVEGYQGNRNPFIDRPDWVACLYNNVCDGSGGGGDPPPPPPPPPPPDPDPVTTTVFINELHYDNKGSDRNEMIEVAGTAGVDLTGWQLIAYNGSGGTMYKVADLSGTIPDQGGCMGTSEVAFSGLQNGGSDGVALVDPAGTVVEFISYEGTLTANDGPAAGMTSTDIGVSEGSGTNSNHSLQRTGTGNTAADFIWQGPFSNTGGSVNSGQTFTDSCGSSGGGGSSAPPWINELHYDNSGTDTGEAIEIAGPAGTDLTDWELVGYNGSGGAVYKVVTLSGTIPSQQSGYGTISFSFTSLQNGGPDGVALVDSSGNVVQFLSYEGSFTAADGPAAGQGSTNIGVSEGSSTAAGHSLQLSGTGCSAADFSWSGPSSNTMDQVNSSQTFSCP